MRSNGIQRPRRQFVRDLVLIAGAAPFLSAGAATQKSARVPRIGYLGGDFPMHRDAFMNELRAQGFVDGENVIIEKRLQRDLADGPAAAKELAALPLDFIVASALPYALMVRAANPDMPMVITTCPGMISNGFARSFEHPGGIYTGIDELPPGVTTKRMTLLKTAVPAARRIALLSTTPGVGGHEVQLQDAQRVAASLEVTVHPYRATTPDELASRSRGNRRGSHGRHAQLSGRSLGVPAPIHRRLRQRASPARHLPGNHVCGSRRAHGLVTRSGGATAGSRRGSRRKSSRAQSRATCQSPIPPGTCSPSMPMRPGKQASRFHRPCWRRPHE